VDLTDQTVKCQNAHYGFDYNPAHKERLMNGFDEMDNTLQSLPAVETYEKQQKLMTPWLFKA
jgi:3-isopropylmalate dehydratase small subunit